jgi:signal transduction histidine kinase
MVIFYFAAISGQVVSTAESTGTILFGVVTIIGSAALFFFLNETLYAVPLGLFLLGFGGLMIMVALVLKRAIREAIALRIQAEQISADLEKALAAARAEREARTRFIAAVSHDLRQPLQAASLFAHSAAREADGAAQAAAIAGAQRGLAEANSLLENMAQHLRVESGAVTARSERLPLAPLIAALEEELRPLAQRAHIDLRCCVAADAAAFADPDLVSRIVRNLVHNAIAHAQCGRIRILARVRGQAQICVIDDGVGIDLAQADTYLAPYSQGPAAQRPSAGSGLGLAIAAELAQLMAGDIALLPSPAGSGLHVRLTLPSASAVAAHMPEEPVLAGNLLAGRRMLVVDDHGDALVAVAGWCRLEGAAEVQTAASETAARERLCQGYRPDLILTDWHIGGPSSSTALIQELRATLPGIQIIVMTGDARQVTQDEITALALPVMLKPVDEAKLAAALAELAAPSL